VPPADTDYSDAGNFSGSADDAASKPPVAIYSRVLGRADCSMVSALFR